MGTVLVAYRFAIGILAAAFFGVALFIVWKQRRAEFCDLHNQIAGRVANLLLVICCLLGIVLAVIAAVI